MPSCYLKVVIGPQGSFFKNVCAAQSRVFCASRTSFWRRFEPHIETTNNTQEWVCLFGCILTRASTEFYRSVLCFFSFLRSTSLTQRGGWTWAFSSSSLRSKFPNCYHWLYWCILIWNLCFCKFTKRLQLRMRKKDLCSLFQFCLILQYCIIQ